MNLAFIQLSPTDAVTAGWVVLTLARVIYGQYALPSTWCFTILSFSNPQFCNLTLLWPHLPTGVAYFNECPQQPNIPNYLLGLALIPLLMIPFVTLPCESEAAQPQEHPKILKACLLCLIGLFIFMWNLAGKDEKYHRCDPIGWLKTATERFCPMRLQVACWSSQSISPTMIPQQLTVFTVIRPCTRSPSGTQCGRLWEFVST